MRDFLLIISIISIIVFGYWIMKKTDMYIEENIRSISCETDRRDNLLRIAFSNPLVADCIFDKLDFLSKKFHNAEFVLYSGNSNDILNGLIDGKIDICFVDQNINVSINKDAKSMMVKFYENEVCANMSDLHIKPLNRNIIIQKAVWKSKNCSDLLKTFADCLNETIISSLH